MPTRHYYTCPAVASSDVGADVSQNASLNAGAEAFSPTYATSISVGDAKACTQCVAGQLCAECGDPNGVDLNSKFPENYFKFKNNSFVSSSISWRTSQTRRFGRYFAKIHQRNHRQRKFGWRNQ